eukprot:scaffold16330_cov172-Amphora_coffeaeformis.AAC.15
MPSRQFARRTSRRLHPNCRYMLCSLHGRRLLAPPRLMQTTPPRIKICDIHHLIKAATDLAYHLSTQKDRSRNTGQKCP